MNGIRNLVVGSMLALALMMALGACGTLGVAKQSDVATLQRQVAVINVTLGQVGTKADKSYVDTEVNKRALAVNVAGELATKADKTALAALETKVDSKAEKSDVADLAAKLAGFDTALAGKADKATVDTLVTSVETKVDGTRLEAELAKKADAAETRTGLQNLGTSVAKKADTEEVRKLERRLVTAEMVAEALGAPQRDAKAMEVIKDFMTQHGATEFVALSRFGLGSDDMGVALKAAPKDVRDAIAALPGRIEKKEVTVVAVYGGQDAVPCTDKKCKDLGERRARALAARVKAPKDTVVKTVKQSEELVHRGGELRFAFVLLKGGGTQTPPSPSVAPPASGSAPGAAAPASAAQPAAAIPPPLGAPAPRP